MLLGVRVPIALVLVGGVSLGFAVTMLRGLVGRWQGAFLAFNDFFAQWSFARFVQTGQAGAALYDSAALHRFQLGLEPALSQSFPFPYPPHYLFLVWPFGWLPFGAAQAAWDVTGLVVFAWALTAGSGRQRGLAVLLAVLAPATMVTLAYGQNGLIEGALLIAGLRRAVRRPVLAGVFLGMATMKPTLGLLVPVALVASGAWRSVVTSIVATGVLAGLAAWAFGTEAWIAWLDATQNHAAWLQSAVSDYRKPTVMATLTLFGWSGPAAQAGQVAVGIAVAGLVAMACWRRLDQGAIAAVLSGTFLALPFAFAYDLPAVTGAVLLLILAHRGPWRNAEIGILAVAVVFPAVTMLTSRFFFLNPLALGLLFGLALWRNPSPAARERGGV